MRGVPHLLELLAVLGSRLRGWMGLILQGWLAVSSVEAGVTVPLFMKQLLFVSLVLLWHVVI